MKKRQIIILVVALVIFGGSFGLMRFLASQKPIPKQIISEKAKKFVKTEKVNYQTIRTQLVAYGRVNSSQPLDLASEVSGRLLAGNITLKAGQKFSKGTLLFKIDDSEQKLRLQAAKSGLLKDIAGILADFKIDFGDSYSVWSNYFKSIELEKPLPIIPQPKNDKEKTYLAIKNIYNTYYTIKSTEANLDKYLVYAPFDGAVAELQLEIGSFVNPGTRIARLLRTDKLELKVPIETANIDWLNIGMSVKIATQSENMTWQGTINRIGDLVNPATQSLDVFVAITPNEYKIYDGMYLKVNIAGKELDKVMEMPRNAIFNENYVYVLQDSSLITKQIKIQKINQETVIFSGLDEGLDLVVEPLTNVDQNTKASRLNEQKTNVENPADTTKKLK